MILLIILFILFLLLLGLLFLPVSIVIDTEGKTYFLSIPVYFTALIAETKEEAWRIRIRIFLIPFSFKPGRRQKSSPEKTKSASDKRKKKRTLQIDRLVKLTRQIIRSIQIKKLSANIDTGDFPLNAQLIPVVAQINRENIFIGINFEDTNSVYIRAVTHLYKLIWIMIRYIFF